MQSLALCVAKPSGMAGARTRIAITIGIQKTMKRRKKMVEKHMTLTLKQRAYDNYVTYRREVVDA